MEPLTWEEYHERRIKKSVALGIDNSVALGLIGYLPKRYQVAHAFWSAVWMLSIPAFICVAIFFKWWIGVLLLVFVTPSIARATKKSAAEFVLEHADADRSFFEALVAKNLVVFKELPAS